MPNMFCPHCGELIDEQSRYCSKCGRDPHRFGSSRAGSKVLQTIAQILALLIGLYGLILDFVTLYAMFGFGGVVLGFFFSPLIVALIPIYFLLSGYWWPVIIIYGGGILSALLYNAGEKV